MLTTCPQCGASLPDLDFGVATCPQCQAVLFIDMDGNASMNESIPMDEAPHEEPTPSSEVNFQDQWMVQQEQSPEPEADYSVNELESQSFQEPKHESSDNSEFQESTFESGDKLLPEEPQFEAEVPADPGWQAGTTEDAPLENETPDQGLEEVSDFANTDQAFGPYSYHVTIEGIDTQEIRKQLQEALDDPKFGWEVKEVMKQIKLGRLKFEGLNPVKASVLIHRLQNTPMKVSWVQNAYS